MLTNATGFAVANANFTVPGFFNVSATYSGNTTNTPPLNGAAAYAGCASPFHVAATHLLHTSSCSQGPPPGFDLSVNVVHEVLCPCSAAYAFKLFKTYAA